MPTVAVATYFLCFGTSVICLGLLFRSWWRTRTRLLMWSALCFVGLAINNLLLIADLVFLPGTDLRLARAGTGLLAVTVLLIGFIWDTD